MMNRFFSIFSKRRNYDEFVITPAGRDEMWLIKGDHRINIFAELSHNGYSRIIVLQNIKNWEPPFEAETITEQEKKRMAGLVLKYFNDIGENCMIS